MPHWTPQALEASRVQIQHAHEEARHEAATRDAEYRAIEIDRADRLFRYQQVHLKRRIQEGERWVSEVESSGSEGQKRVLPARKGRLNKDRERLEALRENFDLQTAAIRTRRADVSLRVVAAGLVVGHE